MSEVYHLNDFIVILFFSVKSDWIRVTCATGYMTIFVALYAYIGANVQCHLIGQYTMTECSHQSRPIKWQYAFAPMYAHSTTKMAAECPSFPLVPKGYIRIEK